MDVSASEADVRFSRSDCCADLSGWLMSIHEHPSMTTSVPGAPAPRRIATAYVQSERGRPPLGANMEGGTTLLSSTFGTRWDAARIERASQMVGAHPA